MAEYPSRIAGERLALILTGDDGVTASIQALATQLARTGVPAVVLTPDGNADSPDATSAVIDRVARTHLAAWGRGRLLMLGAARGADIIPFVVNRIGDDLRDRVDGIVLFGLESRVSFPHHWRQPWRSTPDPTGLPVLPELERLRGVRMLCLYRNPARETFCSSLDPTLAQRDRAPERADGEREGVALARRVTRFISSATPAHAPPPQASPPCARCSAPPPPR